MKKLTYSFPAKILAVFLFVFCALGCGGFALTAIVAYLAGFFMVPAHCSLTGALDYLGAEGKGYLSCGDIAMIRRHDALFGMVLDARYASIAFALIFLILFILLFIYLMCAAGRKAGSDEPYLGVFDKIPFDIALFAFLMGEFLLVSLAVEAGISWLVDDPVIYILLAAAIGVVMLLLALWTFYTFAARVKAGQWWRNTVTYMALKLLWRCAKWLGRCVRGVWRWLARLFRALRLEWRTGLAVVAMVFAGFISLMAIESNAYELAIILFLAEYGAAFAVLVFSAYQFRVLRAAGQKLAAGELDFNVDTSHMYFDFRRHGEDLNSIGQGMSAAVEQRMRSERLKTELITNVSHDIKTPLTSIVNYVDLLRKPHTPEEEGQYLEVLARQSDKLRRLTVDLVEASKASTGNLPTELAPTNSLELINQAVAEYADKFEQGRLEPVVTSPEKPITVLADGRHLWRVLDNLFNNAVKYAQPGTRVYVDARRLDGGAVISVKNISRDRLNISAEELMERFVRGDQSRHTEGSGLGLSIARSLTELMGGTFDIAIDGDLFKAEIRLRIV